MHKKFASNLFLLLILLAGLAGSVFLVGKVQEIRKKASGQPANILVDASTNLGPITPLWQALAQGGEEKNPFDAVTTEIMTLKPKFIRIDHIYDFYDVVSKKEGQLVFNWFQLDRMVNQIISVGAKPFLSLSYMPTAIAQGGEITNMPVNWGDWQTVVRETIQHYSGKNNKNLSGVVYEVWNEPDLFGGWKINGEKDYLTLYQYAVLGALEAQNTNPFKIGGPAITVPYKNWVGSFLDSIINRKLRIDFYSWHRYSTDPQEFLKDINLVDSWLSQNAGSVLERYLTEWGSISENSPLHDSDFDAAHLVATIRQLLQRVEMAFIFEIKDGPSSEAKKYWGRWGLLTHESAGPIEKKPKYEAMLFLNQMLGSRLFLSGEGTWVTGFASKEGKRIKILLANLDQENSHFESVPVRVDNLEKGNYKIKMTYLRGMPIQKEIVVDQGFWQQEVPLNANNIVLVELALK